MFIDIINECLASSVMSDLFQYYETSHSESEATVTVTDALQTESQTRNIRLPSTSLNPDNGRPAG